MNEEQVARCAIIRPMDVCKQMCASKCVLVSECSSYKCALIKAKAATESMMAGGVNMLYGCVRECVGAG